MHRPFLLNLPLTLTFKTFEKISQQPFSEPTLQDNILVYNNPV